MMEGDYDVHGTVDIDLEQVLLVGSEVVTGALAEVS